MKTCNTGRRSQLLVLLALAFVSFVTALSFRLPGISSLDPQADEFHWRDRSFHILERLWSRHWTYLTTHMGHPGVPPGLMMAGGELAALKIKDKFKLEENSLWFLDKLSACRLPIAITSSLAIPAFFLLCFTGCNLLVAFLASMFLALSPTHTDLSRWAHLDAVLTLLVAISSFAYFVSTERSSFFWRMLAGFFWGLSIATKPTAGILVLVFFVYKCFLYFFPHLRADLRKECPISFWDFWALIIGHITFSAIYTRLWLHESDYLVRLEIESTIADAVYSFGSWFQLSSFLGALMFFLILLVFLYFRNYFGGLGQSTSIGIILLASILVFPQVIENLIRYWTWVFGLQSMGHESYTVRPLAPDLSYWSLLVNRMPVLILSGVGLGLMKLAFRSANFRERFSSRERLLLFSAILFVVWPLVMEVSTKRTMRYLLPIFPSIMLLAAEGWLSLVEVIEVKFQSTKRQLQSASAVILFGLLAFSFIELTRWSPAYGLYFNPLFGGLKSAAAANHPLPFFGINNIIKFLHKQGQSDGKKNRVAVLGDSHLVKLAYERLISSEQHTFEVVNSSDPEMCDYVISFAGFDLGVKNREAYKEIFKVDFRGVTLARVLVVPYVKIEGVMQEHISTSTRKTGRLILAEAAREQGYHGLAQGGEFLLIGERSKHNKGYLLHNQYVRLLAGEYKVAFQVARWPLEPVEKHSKPALRIDFGSNCQRVISLNELSSELRYYDFHCTLERASSIQLRAYWWGNASLALGSVAIYPIKTQ